MAPGCADCEEIHSRLNALETENKKLQLELENIRNIRDAEIEIDYHYTNMVNNTVNELHTEREDVSNVDKVGVASKVKATPNAINTSPRIACAPRQTKKKEPWSRRSPPPLLRSFDSSSFSNGNASLSSPITPPRFHSQAQLFNTRDFPPLPSNNQLNSSVEQHNKGNNLPKPGGKAKGKLKNTTLTQFGLINPSGPVITKPHNKINPPAAAECHTTVDTLLIGDGSIRGIRLANTVTRYYCGGTINTVTHVLPHLMLQYPQCHSVIVHVGANDVLKGHSSAKIERDFGDLIELIRRHNKILYLSGPFPRPGGNRTSDFQITGRLLQLSQYLEWKVRMRPSSLGGFSGHFHTHWEMPWLFNQYGTLNKQGIHLLKNNIRNLCLNNVHRD